MSRIEVENVSIIRLTTPLLMGYRQYNHCFLCIEYENAKSKLALCYSQTVWYINRISHGAFIIINIHFVSVMVFHFFPEIPISFRRTQLMNSILLLCGCLCLWYWISTQIKLMDSKLNYISYNVSFWGIQYGGSEQ